MEPGLEEIKANLFPAAHAAIGDWRKFPWHRDKRGAIQSHKIGSSQALAIDVFGTIKASPDRDRILGALADRCGMPGDPPWTLELEWMTPKGLLGEPTSTQVDALALSARAALIIECKFTEVGGGCSQPKPTRKGANRGVRQCSGNYEHQINPANGREARCALSAKGVKYWDVIPLVFGIDPLQNYKPCPFRGESYQWMRNLVLAACVATERGIPTAVMAAYADGERLATARKVRAGYFSELTATGSRSIIPISYQEVLQIAKSKASAPNDWDDLLAWVQHKIGWADAQLRSKKPLYSGSGQSD